MNRLRRALIAAIAVGVLLLGLQYAVLTAPATPILSILGLGVTVAVMALAVRQFSRLG